MLKAYDWSQSYLQKYMEQPRSKVVFGDDSICTTEGYGSIKCNGIVFTKVAFVNALKYNLISISQIYDAKYIVQFDERRETIFNSNKEVVMIAPRHKRIAHLNFKTINSLAKQNFIIGLPSLVYSKDKPCSSCEKGKHPMASFKTKQTFSIKKCLHLLHMDLFGTVTPRSINHEKYTHVIVDEYSSSSRQWSQDKHIEIVNIIGDPGATTLTRAMARELSTALAHKCLFVDFLSEEEPKKTKQSERGISINHEKYVKDLLKMYDINGSSVKTPMVLPNKLGPDLNGKDINETQYRESHLIAVKRIFRCLKGTPSLGLWYPKCLDFDLKGYSDSGYSGCNMDKKRTSGACQLLRGKLVCWSAKKQQSMAMSSAEAEYVAVVRCCANILWMKIQLTDYDIIHEKVPIFCDNTSAIAISNNPVLHSRTKHIYIRYHFIRDHILKGDIELDFIPTQYQLTDIFTKPLDEPTFKRLIVELANRVKLDFARIIWEDIIHKLNKKTKEKFIPYPRFISLLLEYMMPEYDHEDLTINPSQVFSAHNWALNANQPEGPPFTDHMKAIFNIDVPVESQAPTASSKTKIKTKASKSKTGQSDKEPQSSSAIDKNPIHPSASTPVVDEIHKEAQQENGGPTYLGATTEADPGIYAPNDFIPKQHGVDEGTQNYSLDHIFAGTNPNVRVAQTKSIGDGLKTSHTDLCTNEEGRSDETLMEIKLEDLSNLMQDTRSTCLTLDSPQDEPIIVHLLQSQKDKLEQQKAKDEPEVASLKARPSYPDINQLTKLLVSSLKPELSKLLASHDFSNCLPTELKELPSKITELYREVKELKKHVRDMEIELLGDLKEILKKLETFTSTVSIQEKLKTLDTLPSLLHKFTDTLNKFSFILENASSKATDKIAPSVGNASSSPAKGEKNTNQATKNADNANLNQQPTTTTPPTTSFQYTLFPKSKGKEFMSSKDEETKSDFEDDHANPAETTIESSKKNKLKKFSFITKGGEKIHLTAKKIEEQKRIEETLKAELAKQEVEKVKSELVDLLGIDVVTHYYNKKFMYAKYYDKVLKRRKSLKIKNCDVLITKGPITLKIYREDGLIKVILNLKVSDLHPSEWREVV
ncbi:retrovirus-related pol polyprotein from transposon TNT 1-94 [Tanacetum coccineum]